MPAFGIGAAILSRIAGGGTVRAIGQAIAPGILGAVKKVGVPVALGAAGARLFGGRKTKHRRRRMTIEKLMIMKQLGGSRSIGFQLGLLKLFK